MIMRNILITGGAGFIGSNFTCMYAEKYPNAKIVVLDKMTYAGNLENLSSVKDKITFIQGDIGDISLVPKLLQDYSIDCVFNFAAESHVDNSISNPSIFIETNITGTFNLLRSCLEYYNNLGDKSKFRFLHISTDEVYGSLELGEDRIFDEETKYAPNSPYSASKAASDHLVRSFVHTYNLPCITTNCSNNYGFRQHFEKLIPKMIFACKNEQPITIYGNGAAIRDWIWVLDHCEGVLLAMQKGKIGETYCFGGDCEKTNIEVVRTICSIMDEMYPRKAGKYSDLIVHVQDRPGHDMRYAVSSEKAKKELGFKHSVDFLDAVRQTVKWFVK